VVNLQHFSLIARRSVVAAKEFQHFRRLRLSSPSAFATGRRRVRLAVTIGGTSFDMPTALDSILQSRSAKSSTASTDGLPMLNFRRNFFLQNALAVLFDTAGLSGLYPFATARAHRCHSVLCRKPAGLR
jgi:hypothetical protein